MIHLANALLVALLLTNLTGLALLADRLTGSWILARCASPLLVVVLFFIEHFVGLGSLGWVWPLTTVASVWLIARQWRVLWTNRWTELAYYGAFAYALVWRYSFPDITASSEKIPDLLFVINYMAGVRLPPPDRWFPPSPFDVYYALQHYAAAMVGRILGASSGQAYNLGFCITVATIVTAAAGTAWLLVRRRLAVALLTAALVFGGTGVAPLLRWVEPASKVQLYHSIRFIGSALSPELATLPFGQWLLKVNHVTPNSLDEPVELFSYLVGLGDFHPPLGGYLLLMLALLSIALIETEEAVGPAYALLGATVPLTLAVNTWDLPVQAILAGGYVGYRVWARRPLPWKMLLGGFVAAAVSIQPFLAHFVSHAQHSDIAIRLVPRFAHTPPLLMLLVFYPILTLVGLHLLCGDRSRCSVTFCLLWLLLLAVSELVFVDDLYGGKFERFNTVLKWWSWIYSGTALLIGAFNLRSASRICRWGTAAMLLLICSYARDLGANLFPPPKTHMGQLDGSAWLRDDPATRAILEFLESQPPCLVLQRVADRAYTPEPAVVMFAGQTPFIGWANSEAVSRGDRVDIDRRLQQVQAFYRGELPDSARWLEQNGIQYVLWLKDDNWLPKGTFDKIHAQIQDRYFWRVYYEVGDFRLGIWTRAR